MSYVFLVLIVLLKSFFHIVDRLPPTEEPGPSAPAGRLPDQGCRGNQPDTEYGPAEHASGAGVGHGGQDGSTAPTGQGRRHAHR